MNPNERAYEVLRAAKALVKSPHIRDEREWQFCLDYVAKEHERDAYGYAEAYRKDRHFIGYKRRARHHASLARRARQMLEDTKSSESLTV